MCGIGGIVTSGHEPIESLSSRIKVINRLQRHRGPDGEGLYVHDHGKVGFAHTRLSIIDIVAGQQPMRDAAGNVLVFNGEIYNYIELREQLGADSFRTKSDSEVILHAYRKWGTECVTHLRGMFAFAIWDESRQRLFCARDRFGIKPFYYSFVGREFYFASEAKALLPFQKRIETDVEGFKDYLAFQFCLAGKSLFKNISELPAGHHITVETSGSRVQRYWEVYYNLDWDHTSKYFQEKLNELLTDSVHIHLRSDVPVGAYVSGGIDSSLIASIASGVCNEEMLAFTGKFTYGNGYDESEHARALCQAKGIKLLELDITCADFIDSIRKVIYHLDTPVAGPGSFPQYMISKFASAHRKVVIGGQGGDEIFGGYSRYLIAYFEQCIKAAIEGTTRSGNFVVTYESIIPNLKTLKAYKPLLQDFWRDGLFDDMDKRYFRLVNRAPSLGDEVNWNNLDNYSPYETFRSIFHGSNVQKESYFDQMTHFDFKTLLPALLHVEDRVSMAHGVESRVPLLDHPLVECAATIPSNIKFKDGALKHILKKVSDSHLPSSIIRREDKMGFPVPLTEWIRSDAREFVRDIFATGASRKRDLIDNARVIDELDRETKFGRKVWGLLSLELWQQEFHDKEAGYKGLLQKVEEGT